MELNFKEKYRKCETVYMVRYIENVGIREVKKLELRTVESDYMVGNCKKTCTQFINSKNICNVFKTISEANEYLASVSKNVPVKRKTDIPSQLEDIDEDDESDNIYSYIDGDPDEEEEGECEE